MVFAYESINVLSYVTRQTGGGTCWWGGERVSLSRLSRGTTSGGATSSHGNVSGRLLVKFRKSRRQWDGQMRVEETRWAGSNVRSTLEKWIARDIWNVCLFYSFFFFFFWKMQNHRKLILILQHRVWVDDLFVARFFVDRNRIKNFGFILVGIRKTS